MRWLLSITLLFLLATEVFHWDLTYAAGLSAKNAVLYLLIVFLLLRLVVTRTGALEARPLYAAWGVLIGYAILTWIAAGLLVGYERYDLVESGIRLKSGLIDHFIFFLVFFLGTRTEGDAVGIVRALLFGSVLANLAQIADVTGVVDFGYVEREDGRVQGALGESNQYAAYIILTLPAIIATAIATRGVRRLFWVGGTLVTAVALMMTASRGALVGALVAGVVGAYLYRHYWSLGRLTGWIIGGLTLLVILSIVSQSDELLAERVLTQTGSIDLSDVSSGRSEIWSAAIEKMISTPITLLTGFGWNVYWSFPFRYSPHNHYLSLWFNLGLVGLITGTFVLYYVIRRARLASERAVPPARGLLIGYVIGAIALCVAIFFVDLHQPWPYFWVFSGLILRLALLVHAEQTAAAPAQIPAAVAPLTPGAAVPGRIRDAHGWVARPGSTRATHT